MNLSFEIAGTHEGDQHALPKIKRTRRQHWMKDVQRYVAWKRHVQTAFFAAAKLHDQHEPGALKKNQAVALISTYPEEICGRKPIDIQPAAKARMDIVIHFKNGRHADPENIFGSIADALFKNDNRLSGSFDFVEDAPQAKVDVSINITKR